MQLAELHEADSSLLKKLGTAAAIGASTLGTLGSAPDSYASPKEPQAKVATDDGIDELVRQFRMARISDKKELANQLISAYTDRADTNVKNKRYQEALKDMYQAVRYAKYTKDRPQFSSLMKKIDEVRAAKAVDDQITNLRDKIINGGSPQLVDKLMELHLSQGDLKAAKELIGGGGSFVMEEIIELSEQDPNSIKDPSDLYRLGDFWDKLPTTDFTQNKTYVYFSKFLDQARRKDRNYFDASKRINELSPSRIEFDFDTSKGWQSSNIKLSKGERVKVSVEGNYKIGNKILNANGIKIKGKYKYNVIAKMGKYGTWPIGTMRYLDAPDNGSFEFMVNGNPNSQGVLKIIISRVNK